MRYVAVILIILILTGCAGQKQSVQEKIADDNVQIYTVHTEPIQYAFFLDETWRCMTGDVYDSEILENNISIQREFVPICTSDISERLNEFLTKGE